MEVHRGEVFYADLSPVVVSPFKYIPLIRELLLDMETMASIYRLTASFLEIKIPSISAQFSLTRTGTYFFKSSSSKEDRKSVV